MRAYRLIRGYMLLIAASYALYACVDSILVAHAERSPTPIRLEHFARDYHGQRWVALTGDIDLDHAMETRNQVGTMEVWAPMRQTGGGGSEPVHAYLLLGPFSNGGRIPDKYADSPVTVTGSQVFFDPDKVLPGVRHGDPIIMVQEGNSPVPANSAWIGVAIFGAMVLPLAWFLVVCPIRAFAASRMQV